MENLEKENVEKVTKPHLVCHSCLDTLEIKVKHDENMPAWLKCYGCGREKWCCRYWF